MMVLLPVWAARAVPIVEADVCIYGGTSGGVVAAVQAARMGKTVALIATGRHLGGMSSGGLSATDVGARETLGGIAKEFYQRVGAHYGSAARFAFEPHIAEEVFEEMLSEAGVVPHRKESLFSLVKSNGRLTEIKTTAGTIFRARQFIDASYEGELMARAGVTFTLGREGRDVYGESLAGVRTGASNGQFLLPVDPYLVPRRPTSRTLPWIAKGSVGAPGAGDQHIQTYNYRLCITAVPANRLPIVAPDTYDERQYALLARFIEASAAAGQTLKLADFLAFSPLPNGKFDVNSRGPFSTDCIGLSDAYPNAAPVWRSIIAVLHRRYVQGFLYYLGHSRHVPAAVRTEMLAYGLCRDEFRDTAGWPHQLYVREARRMVGGYVMRQQHCDGEIAVPDPIALGSYAMDAHSCQRVVEQGEVKNEGGIGMPPREPYGISYRALVPQEGECENLFVPFALSASHVAFASIRMEPVFMMSSQSAATAACLALDAAVPVQRVSYAQLAARLIADGQILAWPLPPPGAIVVDDAQPEGQATGAWQSSRVASGFYGADYLHDGNAGKGEKTFRFTPNLPAAGDYDIYLRWTAAPNRASNVPVDIFAPAGTSTVIVDQTRGGAAWVLLGRWNFRAGTAGSVLIRTTGTDGYVIADAACWLPAGAALDAGHAGFNAMASLPSAESH